MTTAVNLLLGIALFAIVWEDCRNRTVRTYWFIGLFAVLLYLQLITAAASVVFLRYTANLLFVLFILVALHGYFAIKARRWIWIMDQHMGWGDVAFLVCITGVWSLQGFVAFMVISLLFSLAVFMLCVRRYARTIPLAGLQALCFGVFYILEKNKIIALDNWIRL